MLTTALDSIVDHLTKLRRPLVPLLQPGLTRSTILELFRPVSINPPQALVELYSWRNGVPEKTLATLNDLNFIPGYCFISLQEALAHYRILTTPYPDVVWNPLYFPFLIDGSDGSYAIRCSASDLLADGDIIWTLCGNTIPVYESLDSMLLTIQECYKAGAFFVTPEGSMDWDNRAEAEIAQRLNPSIAYWKRPIS